MNTTSRSIPEDGYKLRRNLPLGVRLGLCVRGVQWRDGGLTVASLFLVIGSEDALKRGAALRGLLADELACP